MEWSGTMKSTVKTNYIDGITERSAESNRD